MAAAILDIPFDCPPFRLSGAVYGTLLNHASALQALAGRLDGPPYGAPPRAPVLYIKPRNTLTVDGAAIEVPAQAPELEIGACVGVVIGRTACRLTPAAALDHVAGYVIVDDVSIPHADYYRPAVRCKARDGFCPLGPRVTARAAAGDPDALSWRVHVDGKLVQTASTADLVRPVARLLSDVTEFMTLAPGDVLALGAAAPAPRVRAGQTVAIDADGLGTLSNSFVAARA